MPLRKEESKTKKIIFTAVIAFVFITSIIGFSYSAIFQTSNINTGTYRYNGIEFVPTQFGLGAIIDGQPMEFYYLPEDVASIDVDILISRIVESRSIYATSDVNSTFASPISGLEFEMAQFLDSRHNSFLETAFTTPNSFGKKAITCADATEFVPVIYFNFTNSTTGIDENGNCVVVNFASQTDFDRYRDRIIYEILGIRP